MPELLNTSHSESNEGTRLIDRLEALLLDRMTGIADSVAAIQASKASCNDTDSAVVQYQGLSARLVTLEESVARLCTLLGRLDQEFQTHRNAPSHDGQ